MSDLILEQFTRLLDGLDGDSPWPQLAESGFLDLLRSEDDGGAALDLEGLFPLTLEAGRRPTLPCVIQTMIARLAAPEAVDVVDVESVLADGGVDPAVARALAAAATAGLMAGALEAIEALTLDYAATRKQFGREIGKFQAIQHQIAVMAEEVMAARMAVQLAFVGAPLAMSPLRAGVAKLRVGEAALTVAAIAHAVHGAIGVSQEHSLRHFTGRLHEGRLAHGGEAAWARRLGGLALDSDLDAVSLARSL